MGKTFPLKKADIVKVNQKAEPEYTFLQENRFKYNNIDRLNVKE